MKYANYRIFLLQIILLTCCGCFVHAQQIDNLRGQRAFAFNGNMSANLIGYNATGIENRMHPFAMMLSANATASVYGISIPFSLRYSNRRVSYAQPFNQFGLSPSYKWATAHFGYRTVSYSQFTLAGHNFLGGGVDLNPGKLRFGFVYGRFRKSATVFKEAVDTTHTFTRKGYSARIGVGSERTFVDLIFMQIKDDSTSIANISSSGNSPAEMNTVSGLNSRIHLSETLFFESELAASIYTTDMAAPDFDTSDEIGALNPASKFLVVNQSTELLTAIRSSLMYKTKPFSAKLEYRRVDPGYRSMGAYFFNNDIENVTIAPAFSLFERKLNLRGSIGLQRDNLRNTKKSTSLRTISSFNASYNPLPEFGIDFIYSNYSSNQRAGRLPLIDSLKLYQTTSNLSVMPRLVFTNSRYNHIIMMVISRMNLNDRNLITAQYTENQASIFNLNYHLNLLQHGMSVLFGINYNMLENYLFTSKASGVTAGVSKTWLQGQLMMGWNNSVIQTDQPIGKGWVINSNLYSTYQLTGNHHIRFNFYFINSAYPDGSPSQNFNELKGDMSYVYTF